MLSREPAFNPGAPLLGRVRLLDELGAVVHQWTSPQPNDLFGLSAIITPDVNADGVADVAIAIPNAFDDVAGTRVGLVIIKSGASGATLTTISGTPLERFGLALFAAPPEPLSLSPTLTVLVEALDPQTSAPSGSFTFQSFDAFSGAFLTEAVQAPEGFTASAAALSIATHIRAAGPGDLNASGDVSPADFAILANNYGAAVDHVTGELLSQDPSLAAAPTGDTNGDGVVDSADLNTVLSSIGQQFGGGWGGGFEFEGEELTEAEASAVEAAFGNAAPQGLDCKHCALCHKGWCQVIPDKYGEAGGDDPPEFDDGTEGTQPPEGGNPPNPGGGGGNPFDVGPDGDENGDGIPNKDDCSAALGGASANCNCSDVVVKTDIGGDTDSDGISLNDPDETKLIDHDGDEHADPPVDEGDQTDPIELEDIGRPGMIILVNDDDDDLDGTPDRAQNGPLDGYVKDNELVAMHLQITPNRTSAGQWSISFDTDRFRMWTSSTRVARWDAGTPYALPVPFTVYVEAIAPSGVPGDATFTLQFIPDPADCADDSDPESGIQASKLTDSLRVTAVRLEMFDLRHWGPGFNGTQPFIQNRNLDQTGMKVGGAITDGASICLLRLTPPLSEFVKDGIDDDHRSGVDDEGEFWEVLNEIEIELAPRLAPNTWNPDVVGTAYGLKRPADPDGPDQPGHPNWDTPSAAIANALPQLPVITSIDTGAINQTTDVRSDDGLWFYVPPEGFLDDNGLAPSPGDVEKATLTIPIRFNGLGRGNMDFILRRPPIVLVHGFRGGAAGYWSTEAYNEATDAPLPTRLYYADYGETSHKGYAENFFEVYHTIATALNEYRTGSDSTADEPIPHDPKHGFNEVHYAATRVDAIGHSMGGQLIRVWLSKFPEVPIGYVPSYWVIRGGLYPRADFDRLNIEYLRSQNWGAGDIRRFATIGSPFMGSPLASHWAAKQFEPAVQPEWRVTRWANQKGRQAVAAVSSDAARMVDANGQYDAPTAIVDLMTGSRVQAALEAAEYPTGRRMPPWMAIAGRAKLTPIPPQSGIVDWISMMIITAMDDDSVANLDPMTSDLVVTIESQLNIKSASSPNNAFPVFDFVTHTYAGSLSWPQVEEPASLPISHTIRDLFRGLPTAVSRGGTLK